MKHSFRNSITFSLIALILFSTIGFNVIVSFCGGCESEHVSVALTADTSSECSCCIENESGHNCCNPLNKHERENHHKKNFLAQLKYDSTEAKSKILKIILPVITFYSITIVANTASSITNNIFELTEIFTPPSSGRSILTSICVLRN